MRGKNRRLSGADTLVGGPSGKSPRAAHRSVAVERNGAVGGGRLAGRVVPSLPTLLGSDTDTTWVMTDRSPARV